MPDEELLRAQTYALLARLLAEPPGGDLLDAVAAVAGDASPLGAAFAGLADAARRATPAAVAGEHMVLFVGVGGSEMTPYGSYYLTGFLNEKPLADLRADMARLGIARADEVKDPEDHIAALCEMMAGLITGTFAAPADLETQRAFYERHIGSWAPRFFVDLEAAPSAAFYRAVGTVGRRFLEVEGQAFAMTA
ncbi:TorD/DmsD family molecular chaperone [Azospirillum sp. ST 5-10]|uniref:TorD/DmsD family molecular chaperone n=1 Tax=unclassified Azospirillum TaxID=2630922 RepID=UPI003F49F72B